MNAAEPANSAASPPVNVVVEPPMVEIVAPLPSQPGAQAAQSGAQSGAEPSTPKAAPAPSVDSRTDTKIDHRRFDTDRRSAESDKSEDDAAPPRSHWYGWQTLAVDGVALVTLAASNNKDTVTTIGLVTYAFGPMIVHMAHGRPGIGLADTGIRIGAPIGLALLGAAVGSGGGNGEDALAGELTGFVLGAFIGYAAAVAIDAAVLAREPAQKKDTGIQWTPTVATQKGGATFGLAGIF